MVAAEAVQKITISPKVELVLVAAALVVFALLNLGTGTRSPMPWGDEIQYTDPAVNLLLGNGFTSSAQKHQTMYEFWAACPPLYSALLYVWIRLLGFNLLAVRALNYTLFAASVFLVWLFSGRTGLVRAARYRLVLVALLLLGKGVTFSYRTARYDCIAILLVSACALTYSISNGPIRRLSLFALAALFPSSALPLLAYSAILCSLLLVALRAKFWREFLAIATGALCGLGILYIFYSSNDAWRSFLTVVALETSDLGAVTLQLSRKLRYSSGFSADHSFLLLLLVTGSLLARKNIRAALACRPVLLFGVGASICVPVGVFFLGHYPLCYSWMAYFPLSVCLCAALSSCSAHLRGKLARIAIYAGISLACLVGLPAVLLVAAYDWKDRDPQQVEALAARHVSPQDWVYCEPEAYFAVKPRAHVTVVPAHLAMVCPEDKKKISVLMVRPEGFRAVTEKIGGQWHDTGEELAPRKANLFGKQSLFFEKYWLRVYRRAAP